MKIAIQILRLTKPKTRIYLVVAFGAGLITAVLGVYLNVLYGQLAEAVAKLIADSSLNVVSLFGPIIGLILGLYIINAPISYVQERRSDQFQYMALNELRRVIYAHINKLPLDYFLKNRAGKVVQRSLHVNSLVNWTANFTSGGLYTVFSPLFALVPLYIFHPIIGAISTIGILVIIIIQFLKSKYRQPHLKAAINEWEEVVGMYNEHIANISTSRTTVSQNKLSNMYYSALNSQNQHRLKQTSVEQIYNASQIFFEGILMVSLLTVTLYFVTTGAIGIAAVVSIFGLTRLILVNSRGIAGLYTNYNTAVIEAKNFFDLLNEPIDSVNQTGTKSLKTVSELSFENVSYTYHSNKISSLENISFKLSKHQRIGIVGSSGSGKSTVVKLATRLVSPDAGDIKINGVNIGSYFAEDLRLRIGVVMQDVVLFHASVMENVRLANPKASDEEIMNALETANATEFVTELPEGIHTVVGERGVRLSGGQKQRIAIARAAVKNPSLLILDEATSSLDSTSEKAVQKGLKQLLENSTALIIAHRLSTIKECDLLIVIEKGKIVEQGSHQELLKLDGRYKALWDAQSR